MGVKTFENKRKEAFWGLCQISNFDLKSITGSKNLKFWI
jgi:hypothetical protein